MHLKMEEWNSFTISKTTILQEYKKELITVLQSICNVPWSILQGYGLGHF